jgi:hypothetical protein
VSEEQAAEQAAPPPAQPEAAPKEPRESWLWSNRLGLALGLALFEGLVVFFEEDFSRVTVIVIAIPIILFYLLAGRTLESRLGREISWILAMSQALAVVVAILALALPVIALVLAGIFGLVAAYLIFYDRPDRARRQEK